jgi:transcriptional regulator with XRE-family HTH domain
MAEKRKTRSGKRRKRDKKEADPIRQVWAKVVGARRRMRSDKLTQQGLSSKAGLPSIAVGALERGTREVTLEQLVRIAVALDIPAEVLIEEFKAGLVEAMRPVEERLGGKPKRKSPDGSAESQGLDEYVMAVMVARIGGNEDDLVRMIRKMLTSGVRRRDPAEEDAPQEEG